MGAGLILALVAYFGFFGVVIYGFFCADPHKSSTGDLFQNRIPNFINNCGSRVFGLKISKKLDDLSKYFLQVVYLIVVLGSWSVMFAHGYPLIEESSQVSSYHQYTGYVVFVLCMSSWRYACRVSPGFITENSIPKFDNYPYDNLLYTNKKCPTVGIRKLARSKYDRFSKRHVARFDHFCGWLNQPVGEENYRYFLFFLIVHFIMCLYGSVVTALLFYGEIVDKDLLNARFFNAVTGAEVKADKMIVFHFLMMTQFYLAIVLLLMSIMVIMLGVFLGFHLYITAQGMTTNEYFKWKEVRKWHKKATKDYQKALKEGKVVVNSSDSEGKNNAKDGISDETDIGCTGPTASNISNSTNTKSNKKDDDDDEEEIMDPGPFPQNIYNNGIIENFKEVIYPRSFREDAIKRWVDWHRANEHLRKDSKENTKNGEIDDVNGKAKII